ncbi:MAG: diguanylate cyclase [Candidatus Omnitrophica bacterium]|jgi:diguanylate cyclase (GGDEF)-like protein|nr:diguanylate cyclase [Candidatus Omnitrophota bacterium]MDD5691178.1 diguanylate cyclase [Candidatus Omnitrophota bacterium]
MKNDVKAREFNILVVEDDERTFKTIKDGLINPEYKLHRVTTGQEAINLAKEGYFVAIITEMQIGDMNGIELIRRLKKIDQRINIIGLTVYAFVNLAVEAMKEGVYSYLMKPINTEELNLVLRRAIENTFLLIQAGQRKYYQDIATMDGLTGVYNHRHFHEMLDWNISHLNRSPQAFSLFITDIDDFKKYNDTHGHVEGDKILHNFAQLLVSSTRDNDMVFRYGGEEFAVILSQTDQFSAQKAGERLLVIVRSRMPITMSVGLASFPLNAQIKSELVIRADKALYRAKKTGKNRLCTFDEKIDI